MSCTGIKVSEKERENKQEACNNRKVTHTHIHTYTHTHTERERERDELVITTATSISKNNEDGDDKKLGIEIIDVVTLYFDVGDAFEQSMRR